MRKQKNALNAGLHKLGLVYHDGLPLKEVGDLLESNGFDREAIDGIYTGHDGHDSMQLKQSGKVVPCCLHMNWHRMESGRYEIVAYVN